MLILFFVGLSVLLYPAISTYWNEKHQTGLVDNYENMLNSAEDADFTADFEAAYQYNDKLAAQSSPLSEYHSLSGEYNNALNPMNNGMMGYIDIDTIGVKIPIYHGISDTVLAHAAGHMEGTSLPVGGESTHSVLSAHRGLPSAKLFTDLDKVQIGDIFKISVLGQVLWYEVDQIIVVTPENTTDIRIIEGKDYCTLVTCTPYGINTHRLLVRGVRTDAQAPKSAHVGNEAYRIDTLIVTPIVALPILAVLILYVSLQPVKKENLIEGDDI